MIIWTPTVFSVLYACVLYFCICTCSAQLSMFHMERRSRNTFIITACVSGLDLSLHSRLKEVLLFFVLFFVCLFVWCVFFVVFFFLGGGGGWGQNLQGENLLYQRLRGGSNPRL